MVYELQAKRYNPTTACIMDTSDDGRWIHYIDYQELEAKLHNKETVIAALKKMVDDHKGEIEELTNLQQVT
jgi:hypothetical protein